MFAKRKFLNASTHEHHMGIKNTYIPTYVSQPTHSYIQHDFVCENLYKKNKKKTKNMPRKHNIVSLKVSSLHAAYYYYMYTIQFTYTLYNNDFSYYGTSYYILFYKTEQTHHVLMVMVFCCGKLFFYTIYNFTINIKSYICICINIPTSYIYMVD